MPVADALLLTCEHASARVPARHAALFAGEAALLSSHRASDRGALELARRLGRTLGAPLVAGAVSRLLVDLNRSLDAPDLHCAAVRALPAGERAELVASYWRPHREAVEREVRRLSRRGRTVLHVGVHAFTPEWKGRLRELDVGLLHDPRRDREAAACRAWRRALRAALPELRVHLNRPYRGWTDGLTTTLRQRWDPDRYLGLELEVNQSWPLGERGRWSLLQRALARTLGTLLPPPPAASRGSLPA